MTDLPTVGMDEVTYLCMFHDEGIPDAPCICDTGKPIPGFHEIIKGEVLMGKPAFAWVDMETTGLDAYSDVPLELGIVLTDLEGGIIAEKKWLVYEQDNERFMAGVRRGHAHPYVSQMHEESGLWDDLLVFKTYARDEVDAEAEAFLIENGVTVEQQIGMAGNSTGSLDRPFSLIHFPKLSFHLGHRNIDISSLKELCKRRNPGLFEQIKHIVENKEAATHRVLDDCRACINEYLTYCDEFLIVE